MLSNEIDKARKEIFTDGYDMSVGELLNMYRDEELIINPEFQRLFRWDITRKSRFIESLLLGVPIPPIFVFQNEDGVWELIDGLQRISTILEFVGILKLADNPDRCKEPSVMEGTRFLPSLAGKRWRESSSDNGDGIGRNNQITIKRARVRVEILSRKSDPEVKYEIFQRLNTGGAKLSEQEVRNCTGLMINAKFQRWLVELSNNPQFQTTVSMTKNAEEKQFDIELVLRFFAFRLSEYQNGLDYHEYLDQSLYALAKDSEFPYDSEKEVFEQTFELLSEAVGTGVFKRWDTQKHKHKGKFLISVFEVIATGVSHQLKQLITMEPNERNEFIKQKTIDLWGNETFQKYSGNVRGTDRLKHLLPLAKDYFLK